MKEDISSIKEKLRRNLLRQRSSAEAHKLKEQSAFICNRINQLVVERSPSKVQVYLPMRNEVDILPSIYKMVRQNIIVAAPECLGGGKMVQRTFNSIEETKRGIFGTSYPTGKIIEDGSFDMSLVPGVAFSRSGDRLGYGGGYYDRFLSKNPRIFAVGVGYDFQILKVVPTAKTDIKLDRIISAYDG